MIVCLRAGITHMGDIAAELGYQNHSLVSKRSRGSVSWPSAFSGDSRQRRNRQGYTLVSEVPRTRSGMCNEAEAAAS